MLVNDFLHLGMERRLSLEKSEKKKKNTVLQYIIIQPLTFLFNDKMLETARCGHILTCQIHLVRPISFLTSKEHKILFFPFDYIYIYIFFGATSKQCPETDRA